MAIKVYALIITMVLSSWAQIRVTSHNCPSIEGLFIASTIHDGNHNTQSIVISREMQNKINNPFSCSKWQSEKQQLQGLDIFASVELIAEQQDSLLHLKYHFKELPSVIFVPSLKKTDQDGWMMGPALASLNLLGLDIRSDAYFRMNMFPEFNTAREFLVFATSPWLGPYPIEYTVMAQKNQSENSLKNFYENSLTSYVELNHRIYNRFSLIYTAGFYDVKKTAPKSEFLSDGQSDFVPRVGFGVAYDSRNSRMNPHFGSYLEMRFTQHGGPLSGPADYQEYLGDFRIFTQVVPKHILHFSALGQYRPGTMGFYDWFHVGGTNSLRAYAPDSTRSGQHEWLLTSEYRYEVADRNEFTLWGIPLYYGLQSVIGVDQAALWSDAVHLQDADLYKSVYTGLHILLPGIDRLRIEYGIQAKKIALNLEGLSIGMFEKSQTQRWKTR
jgi:outer membrane protein assembly factor BamA